MERKNGQLLLAHKKQQEKIAAQLHWLIRTDSAPLPSFRDQSRHGEMLKRWRAFLPQLLLLITALLPFVS